MQEGTGETAVDDPETRPPRSALGVFVAPTDWGQPEAPAGLVATVREATRRGWPVYLGEHAARPDYVPSALAAAAFLAGACPGAHLVTAGVAAAGRDPLSLIRDADVLAEVAASGGGSFDLGLVAGYDPADLPGARMGRRFAALEAVRDLARSRDRRWRLLLGVSGPRGIALAATADGLILPTWVDPELVRTAAHAVHGGPRGPRGPGGSGSPAPSDRRVVVVRRWLSSRLPGDPPAGSRTPAALVLRGGEVTRTAVRALHAAGAGRVVVGPVSTPGQFEEMAADLADV